MLEELIKLLDENKEWLFSGAGFVVVGWIGRLLYKRHQAKSSQTIRSGDGSWNVQAGRDINIGKSPKGKHVEED